MFVTDKAEEGIDLWERDESHDFWLKRSRKNVSQWQAEITLTSVTHVILRTMKTGIIEIAIIDLPSVCGNWTQYEPTFKTSIEL